MPKISFNAQALGIATYDKRGDVGHANSQRPSVAIVRSDTSIESLFKGLGFANVERFPIPRSGDLPAKDVDS